MTKNVRTIVLVIIAFLATAGLSKFILSFKKEAEDKEILTFDKVVDVINVNPSTHHAKISLTGHVQAIDKLALFSEVSGTLINADFKEGVSFKSGTTLININSTEFKNSLKAQKSSFVSQVAGVMGDLKSDFPEHVDAWEVFLKEVNVDTYLPKLPKMSDVKLKTYLSGKNLLNSYYAILAKEEKLKKYSVSAPFNGVVTLSNVTQGTLIRQGQKLGEFINPSSFEFVTEVSLADLKFLKTGNEVKLYSEDFNKTWKGNVYRINQKLEENTQRIKVYIKMRGEGLKEGLYLYGNLESEAFENTVEIGRMQIENSKVFLVKSNLLVPQEVKVLHLSDDKAIISGLTKGDKVVSSNLRGLYKGLPVKIK